MPQVVCHGCAQPKQGGEAEKKMELMAVTEQSSRDFCEPVVTFLILA